MSFTSTGTVSVEYGLDGYPKVFLKPATHHTVEHLGSRYGVFLPWPTPSAAVQHGAHALLLNGNDIEIQVDCTTPDGVLDALVNAAIESVAVDVFVCVPKPPSTPRLRGANVPARTHKN